MIFIITSNYHSERNLAEKIVLQALVVRAEGRENMWRDQLAAEVGKQEEAERNAARAHNEHLQELEILRSDAASKQRVIEEAVADARDAREELAIMRRHLSKVAKTVLGELVPSCTLCFL